MQDKLNDTKAKQKQKLQPRRRSTTNLLGGAALTPEQLVKQRVDTLDRLASRRARHLARARHPPRCGPGTPQAQADPVVYESARTPLFLGRDASRGSPVRSWLARGGALGHDRPRRPRRHQAHRRKTSPLRCPRTKTRSEPVVSRETAFLIAFSLSPSHIFTFRQKCCHRKVHRNPDARQEPRNQGGVQLPNDEAGGRGRLVVRSA